MQDCYGQDLGFTAEQLANHPNACEFVRSWTNDAHGFWATGLRCSEPSKRNEYLGHYNRIHNAIAFLRGRMQS